MKKPNKYIIYLCIILLIFPIISPVFGQEKQKSDVIFCPRCGKMNSATNKYCFSCGTELLKQKPSEEIPKNVSIQPSQNIPPDTSQIDKTVSDSTINIKAKALYDRGITLYEMRNYKGALEEFNDIVRTYPTSKYYESAFIMMKACQRLIIKKQGIKKGQVKKNTRRSFEEGLKVGCLAVIGFVVFAGFIIISKGESYRD